MVEDLTNLILFFGLKKINGYYNKNKQYVCIDKKMKNTLFRRPISMVCTRNMRLVLI